VIISGNVYKPGTYSLSSVSSVFNALYYSGGPTENGSFRLIEVVRGGKKIGTIDLYQFLLEGEFNKNITLQDNDLILVPTFQRRIEVIGEIKVPGFFELIDGENFNHVLRYSGGFSDKAFTDRIKIYSNTKKERKIAELISSEFNTYHLKSGDKLFVEEILDRFENRVSIEGSVFRPGEFQLESEMTLSQLISKAEGLKQDAFLNKIQIFRKGINLQNQLISVDLNKIISGEISDVILENEDLVKIYSIFDLKEEYFIRVEGEVGRPGELPYFEGMTLEDAILSSGGFRGNSSNQRIEVARRVVNSDLLSFSASVSEVFTLETSSDFKSTVSQFQLKPFDVVVIRSSLGYKKQELVKVEGEVLYPGTYAISRNNERISDLVKRTGGFSIWAYPEGASLRRKNENNSVGQSLGIMENKQNINPNLTDSIGKSNENIINDYLGIDLPRIMENPGSSIDMFLQEGDVLFIPKELQTVKISGEVLFPSTTQFRSNLSLKNYIRQAGGFNDLSKKDGVFIKYANGKVKNSKKILFFSFYPKLEPGAEIVVPKGRTKEPFSLNQLVGITSSLITIYLLINSIQ
jgi:protein involved in polysaccharide export with SLBB domain